MLIPQTEDANEQTPPKGVGKGTITLPGFAAGVNNIQPDFALDKRSLRAGINIDIYDNGKLRRRSGSTLAVGATGVYSAWSDPRLSLAYYVAGTTIYSLQKISGALVSTPVVTGLAAGRKVAYLYLHGDVFWSNGVVTGRIRNNINGGWGVETPATKPILTTSAGGGLDAGRYQVMLTFRNSYGEESGANNGAVIDIVANSSLVVSGFPSPISADITQVCVYITPANGDVFYRHAVLPINTTTHTITTTNNLGAALKTQHLQTMPAGDIIEHLNGVIYVASGANIFYSEPMRFGLCDIGKNFYSYPRDISIMLGVPDGLYICSDSTYWLESPGTAEVRQRAVLPYGGITGTGFHLPDNTSAAWFSPRGQVLASVGGQVKNTSEGVFIPGSMQNGSAILREKHGLRQIVNVVQQTGDNPLRYTGS